jgi:hypothetical protein
MRAQRRAGHYYKRTFIRLLDLCSWRRSVGNAPCVFSCSESMSCALSNVQSLALPDGGSYVISSWDIFIITLKALCSFVGYKFSEVLLLVLKEQLQILMGRAI